MKVKERIEELKKLGIEVKGTAESTIRVSNIEYRSYDNGKERISELKSRNIKRGTKDFLVMEKILKGRGISTRTLEFIVGEFHSIHCNDGKNYMFHYPSEHYFSGSNRVTP